jgi:hypothetical protein
MVLARDSSWTKRWRRETVGTYTFERYCGEEKEEKSHSAMKANSSKKGHFGLERVVRRVVRVFCTHEIPSSGPKYTG